MATVRAVLNKDREKKQGGYSLVIQIIHKRSKRVIYTPYVLKGDEFDAAEQKAIRCKNSNFTCRQIKDINSFIESKKREIKHIITLVSAYKVSFITEDIIREYNQEQSNKYLTTFIERLIAQKEKINKMGTAKALRSTLRSLNKFTNNRMVLFSAIDRSLVKDYESYLAGTGVLQNTINFYMRNFRAIYNLALDSSPNMVDHTPFQAVHMRQEKTDKRALKKEIIDRISKLDLACSPDLDMARDLFMFSFYARGMCFVDIVYLKYSDIIDGVIYYKRHKTNQHIQVAVVRKLQAIINKYKSSEQYVWPFINNSTQPTLYKKYQQSYNTLHRNLKKLQIEMKLSTPLTMHVARHSWATLAKESGAHISAISQGLGHSSEKTTQIYLRDFDNSVIDAVNAKVVRFSIC